MLIFNEKVWQSLFWYHGDLERAPSAIFQETPIRQGVQKFVIEKYFFGYKV